MTDQSKILESQIFGAAMQVKLGMPSEIVMIEAGLYGLRYPSETTVKEAADKITNDYISGELFKRLQENHD